MGRGFSLTSLPPATHPPPSPQGAGREILWVSCLLRIVQGLYGLWDETWGSGWWGSGPPWLGPWDLCSALQYHDPWSGSHILCTLLGPLFWWPTVLSSLWCPPILGPRHIEPVRLGFTSSVCVALSLDGPWQIASVVLFEAKRKQRFMCAGSLRGEVGRLEMGFRGSRLNLEGQDTSSLASSCFWNEAFSFFLRANNLILWALPRSPGLLHLGTIFMKSLVRWPASTWKDAQHHWSWGKWKS